MMEPSQERRPPITPQLALRVAVFGAVAFGLFAIIFFRLWYLQVLSGDKYVAEANSNRVRELRIQAPRGKIVDRRGKEIVRNRVAVVVELDPAKLPDAERKLALDWGQRMSERAARSKRKRVRPIKIPPIPSDALRTRYKRLASVLNTSANAIHRRVVRSLVLVPYSTIRVKTDVPDSVLAYISERPEQFPGVQVEQTYLRDYPQGELAAQIVGTVGEVSPKQLRRARFRGVKPGTIVGQGGLEYTYDRYLRGRDGIQRVQVDAFGRPIPSDRLRDVKEVAGQRLRLSLDLGLERVGQKALAGPLNPGNNPGAFVALDPRTGEVLALGSNPTFDPALLTKAITQKQYELLVDEAQGAPIFNRAISSAYPTGSTFKAITALAGLHAGLITPGATINDAGCIQVGEAERCNAKKQAYGSVDLTRALQVSSDIYFYKLGINAYYRGGLVIQNWARKLGFARRTGIDLPGEFAGLIPDPQWRAEIGRRELACRKEKKISPQANVYAAGAAGCGISDLRPYNLGDTVNLAVGQGDLQATPLQLAVAYGAIANGGKVVRPHLGLEIESDRGELVQRIERDPARRIKIDPNNLAAVANGLHLAASAPGGTSADVFAGWPQDRYPVYGKTGTAQRGVKRDQSWYVAYVPDKKRPIVVAVTVEEGGFGAEVAAPITRLLLAQYYNQEKVVVQGSSQTR
ncbi:MAG: penicillin-binding protein 2 [Solirubrobacteraceae bacterium]|nr:penicillin-binding protein 2 [Solirubrobacteraceae bacterium]